MEVVNDFRRKGEQYVPAIHPHMFYSQSLTVDGRFIIPLGGVANAKTVFCNESGSYTTFVSDEYGFNNQSGIWEANANIAVAFVGDSFAKGACVKQGDGFVDRVRDRVPRTANLANGGNGPLAEFATVKEYLTGRWVDHVFWAYYEGNDIAGLEVEKKTALIRYLDDDYSQHIVPNQKVINAAVVEFVEKKLGKQSVEPRSGRFLLLSNLRTLVRDLQLAYFPDTAQGYLARRYAVGEFDREMFREVMRKAKSAVETSGGRLVFLYLPEAGRYSNRMSFGAMRKRDVIKIVQTLGIDVIDIESVFRRSPDPQALFPLRVHGHYTPEGNRIVAEEILRYLARPVPELTGR